MGVLDEAFAGLATAQAHAAQNLQNARALFESQLQSVFTHRGHGWVENTVDKLSTNLDEFVTGAAQPKLNQKALNSIPSPIPQKLDDQAHIVTQLDALAAETQNLARLYEQKLAALAELKKSLLHQAFSGGL